MSNQAEKLPAQSASSTVRKDDLSRGGRWVSWSVLTAIVVLFCLRNLPWHLDNFDQAKQAYVSFEMVELNHWWFQHTPTQNVATKPPLAGWLSAGIFLAVRWWDFAWRMPSLLPALVILCVLARGNYSQASRMDADQRLQFAGVVAASAFGLNFVAPRLATLVRTDMLLTMFIFLIGQLIFKNVRDGTNWSARDRWLVFFYLLGSMLTKGPIAYAFLLPGLLAFTLLCRRHHPPNRAWSGWWSWILPLLIFVAWAGVGTWRSDEFFDQVVRREFLGRFTTGEQAVHKSQPVYFYLPHLLLKFSPWSFVLIALLVAKKTRVAVSSKPHLWWLACWAFGGLILMSFVPSKRPDRIFPVIPPLAMLLACWFEERRGQHLFHWPARRVAWAAIGLALAMSASVVIFSLVQSHRKHQGALVEFGAKARAASAEHNWRFAAVSGKDEGMLLYLRLPKFTKPARAIEGWDKGEVEALVLPDREWKANGGAYATAKVLFSSRLAPEKNGRYVFIVRGDVAD